MTVRVAIQMDPLDSIKPQTDSTLLLGLEAQRRGYELYYYTPDKLTWRDGKVTALTHRVTLYENHAHCYDLQEAQVVDLSTMHVILLRQDPPFDMSYLTTTYLLEMLHPKTLVVNNPTAVRNHPEKLFPSIVQRYMPPTLISADIDEIKRFRKDHKDIVIKPMYGHGGNGILRLKEDDTNFNSLMQMLFANSKEPLIVQRFLPEVLAGDQRVILIDGEIGGMVKRVPGAGEIRVGLNIGGSAHATSLSARQEDICRSLAATLKEKGLIFTSIDIIGDYLTEINITSPSSLPAANHFSGKQLEAQMWNAIEKYTPPHTQ